MDDQGNGRSFVGDDPVAAETGTLPDRRELALVALERTRMPMVITDPRQPDNPIVLANNAFLELTGYSKQEVLGSNCRFLQGPDTDPSDVQAMREALRAEEPHFEVELLNYRKDGSTFWNQLAVSRITDEAGELIYYFASQKDVTARRKAERLEKAERLLLMEVDHRAMNALALVMSFVSLGDAKDPAAFAAAIRGRVSALASAHRSLAASGWRSMDLREIVLASVIDRVDGQVEVHGDPLEIPALLAQPLALAVHELMTNALRHGALSRPSGTLDVSWRTDPGFLTLDWHERGGPQIHAPKRPGVGLRMVDGLATAQLKGNVDTAWEGDGVRVRLVIPFSNC